MPGNPNKPHRLRVRTSDGKPRSEGELNKLKSNSLQMPFLNFVKSNVDCEFIICAQTEKQIAAVKVRLESVGLVETSGDTTVPIQNARPRGAVNPQRRGNAGAQPRAQGNFAGHGQRNAAGGTRPANQGQAAGAQNPHGLTGKPYGFVSLPGNFTSAEPVWHDGGSSAGRLSGEIRLELTTLTPLLVGWERGQYQGTGGDWPVPANLPVAGQLSPNKSVLCPLRAPWGPRPVMIPGDSLKGFLRHELGGLLGAPMERVAERHYSYRPNAKFTNDPKQRLVARIARVPADGVEMMELKGEIRVRVPSKLELLPLDLRYKAHTNYYRFDGQNGARYLGGQGAGVRLNSDKPLHKTLSANPSEPVQRENVDDEVQKGYLATVRHFIDKESGHFSERHPKAKEHGRAAQERILKAAQEIVFQPGDLIWVEWDTERNCIVSLGWHYYYRWAYTDSVRRKGGRWERLGLFPLEKEREMDDDGAPRELSSVRRLLGFTGDNEGSKGIGEGDYSQLMGRVFVNSALEVVAGNETEEQRFLGPTFLKELGMPRPSAVEHYLKQPHHPNPRPTDKATLMTYGDAAGYDTPGELAGRKYYLDRQDAYAGSPWEDNSNDNKRIERSTLALEASRPNRKFRFTIRFRDLDKSELAAILVALCPNQFKSLIGGNHGDGYCSKLGYARPLGWGSVRIEAKALLTLNQSDAGTSLIPEQNVTAWVQRNHVNTTSQNEWLAIHRHKHPDARDYPTEAGRIYTYHSNLRSEHSKKRRY